MFDCKKSMAILNKNFLNFLLLLRNNHAKTVNINIILIHEQLSLQPFQYMLGSCPLFENFSKT